MILSDDTYNVLKWLALIALPAVATFYGVIAKIWGLPYGMEITTTITAVSTLIGTLIGISQHTISKGQQIGKEESEDDGTTKNS